MRILLLLLFTSISICVSAQRAVVGLPKMNMLYIGLENPIEVAVDGVKAKDLVVEINGGELKGENGKYTFKPDGSLRTPVLLIGIQKKHKIKWVDSTEYRVRKVPNPEILFGTKTGGEISTGEIMTVRQINAGLGEGFVYEGLRYTVISYRITIIGENIFYSEMVKGNRITGKSREAFKRVSSGDRILIDNVETIFMNPTNKVKIMKTAKFIIRGASPVKRFDYRISFIDEKGKTFSYNAVDESFADVDISENYFKDGLWQIIDLTTNKPMHITSYKMDTLMWIKTYYASGNIKMDKTYNYKDSTGTYIDYYENGLVYNQGSFLLHENFMLIIDDSCFSKKFLDKNFSCEMDDVNECMIGKWSVYYPTGKLRETGFMDTTYENRFYFDERIHIYDPNDPYGELEKPLAFSVRHSLWKFYDEKGNLIRQTVYDKGRIKE